MNPPDPPPTPDAYKTAAAQAAANLSVAIGQSFLNNADRVGPTGTSRFAVIEWLEIEDPQYDSNGNQTGTTTRKVPHFEERVQLSEQQQVLFDQQQSIAGHMNEFALDQARLLKTRLGGPITFSGLPAGGSVPTAPNFRRPDVEDGIRIDTADLENVPSREDMRRSIMERLHYQQGLHRTRRIDALADKGIFAGSRAFDDEMRTFDLQTTDANIQAFLHAGQARAQEIDIAVKITDAKNQAVTLKIQTRALVIDIQNRVEVQIFQTLRDMAMLAEAIRERHRTELLAERTIPTNELSALKSGGQVQLPQAQGYRAGHIDATPLASSVYNSAALDMKKWEMQSQQQQQMMGGMLGLGANLLSMGMTGGMGMGMLGR